MPTQIVPPVGVEKVIQVDGRKQAEIEGGARSELLDNLPGAVIPLVGVEAHQVEVELIDGGLGKELAAAEERFQVKELVLDESVDGFDIALVGVSGGRDADVLAFSQGGGESGGSAEIIGAADELRAVVGLPNHVAERNAAAAEMLLDAIGENGAGAGAAPLGEGQEQYTAAHLAGGVLDQRQSEAVGLRPEARDIA